MTDEVRAGREWVPGLGMLEVSAARVALIRGLFELSAFVADHSELPLPDVEAVIFPAATDYVAQVDQVNDVAAALEVTAGFSGSGEHFRAVRRFGPVVVKSVAITQAAMAAHQAHMTYSDNVVPDEAVRVGESR